MQSTKRPTRPRRRPKKTIAQLENMMSQRSKADIAVKALDNMANTIVEKKEKEKRIKDINDHNYGRQAYTTALSAQQLHSRFAEGAISWSKSLVDPQSYPSRIPDSVLVPTALYVSKQTFNVTADTSKMNGRFTWIAQGILGQDGTQPALFQNAVMDTSVNTSFDSPDAFYRYSEGSNGVNLRVDVNAPYLVGASPDQNTWQGYQQADSLTTTPTTAWPNAPRTTSGRNNAGYKHSTSGTSIVTGLPVQTGGDWLIPDGTHYHSLVFSPTSVVDQNSSTFYNFNENTCHKYFTNVGGTTTLTNADTSISIIVNSYSSVTRSVTQRAMMQVIVRPRAAGSPSYEIIDANSPLLEYYSGNLNSCTGAGSSISNDYSNSIVINFFTNWSNGDDDFYFLSLPVFLPKMQTATLFQYQWNSTRSIVDNTPAANDGLASSLRLTSMSALFHCTLPPIDAGGNISGSLMYGGIQRQVFSPTGADFTSFGSVTSQNLLRRELHGNLLQGCYVYWVPTQISDIALRKPSINNYNNIPFIVITGNVANNQTGTQIIGQITLYRIFEYPTQSTLIDVKPQIGSDQTYQCVQAALAESPVAFENPKHVEAAKKLISGAINTATNMLSSPVTKSIARAGMSLLPMFV